MYRNGQITQLVSDRVVFASFLISIFFGVPSIDLKCSLWALSKRGEGYRSSRPYFSKSTGTITCRGRCQLSEWPRMVEHRHRRTFDICRSVGAPCGVASWPARCIDLSASRGLLRITSVHSATSGSSHSPAFISSRYLHTLAALSTSLYSPLMIFRIESLMTLTPHDIFHHTLLPRPVRAILWFHFPTDTYK